MNEATAIAPIQPTELAAPVIDPAEFFKPQLSVAEALERERQLMSIIGSLLKPTTQDKYGNVQFDGADYGVIPGTKNRSLFQTGVEKLALCFGLTVTAFCTDKQEDWTTGFFRYTFKATASFKGHVIREVVRTCHTREKKYAYVWVTRPAPAPDVQKTMIEEMQARWGSEWVNKLRRLRGTRRLHHGRQPRAARHPAHQGRRGTGSLPRERNPGRLPSAGRED